VDPSVASHHLGARSVEASSEYRDPRRHQLAPPDLVSDDQRPDTYRLTTRIGIAAGTIDEPGLRLPFRSASEIDEAAKTSAAKEKSLQARGFRNNDSPSPLAVTGRTCSAQHRFAARRPPAWDRQHRVYASSMASPSSSANRLWCCSART
jgi:hypothetical protein